MNKSEQIRTIVSNGYKQPDKEIALVVGVHPVTVARTRRRLGIYYNPRPDVETERELPINEKSFYLGLALGNFRVQKTPWLTTDIVHVTIATQSKNPKQQELLCKTFASWGETHMRTAGPRIFLPSPHFDFLQHPAEHISQEFLDDKERFAPFLLGLMKARLTSGAEYRLALANPDLLLQIKFAYEKHFGKFPGTTQRVGQKSRVLLFSDPQEAYKKLQEVESVQTLSFKNYLFPEPETPKNGYVVFQTPPNRLPPEDIEVFSVNLAEKMRGVTPAKAREWLRGY